MRSKQQEIIEEAIRSRHLIEFNYDNTQRIVEPFLTGITTAGNISVRGYQVGGKSDSGVPNWKLFTIAKISNITVKAETFNGVRDDYNPQDKAMIKIFVRV